MNRMLALLLILSLSLSAFPALADPLPLLEDLSADLTEPYDVNDPSAGSFVFSCRYPRVDGAAEGGAAINAFYESDLDDTLYNLVPMLQDAFFGTPFSLTVDYEVTCSNDDWFSVLVRTERQWEDNRRITWKAQVFSRTLDTGGSTCELPVVLGTLDAGEKEEWKQEYKTEEAESLVRELVWEAIEENGDATDYGGLTEEYLAGIFFPAEDFYLDENGDPVFFLQPDDLFEEVPEDARPLTFSFSLEDLQDELY